MARLVVAAAVGIVVGVATLNPYLGFGAASLTYGLTGFLDPNKRVLGPRLNDLKAPQASFGAPIAYIEGAWRTAGCYIWASDKRENATTTTQGGKGGPGVDSTTFTYEIDVLIELAINRCQAIRRIWSNGRLVWSSDAAADAETLEASALTNTWRDIRFYNGDPAQLPDPTYEAAVGVGNAPAYRGRTTLMIEGLNLGGSGQLPVLTFEVLSEATLDDSVNITTVADVLLPPIAEGSTVPAGLGFVGIASYAGPDFDFLIANFTGGIGGSYYFRAVASGLSPGYTITSGLDRLSDEGGTVGYGANGFVSGVSDEPGYFLAQSDQGLGYGFATDNKGGSWPAVYVSSENSFCRHASRTLILLVGITPFTTFPHGIGLFTASISPTPLTVAYQPRTAAYYGGEWLVAPKTSDGSIYRYNDGATAQVGTMLDPRAVGISGGTMVTDTVTGALYYLDVAGTRLCKWNGVAWSDYMTSLPSSMQGENQRGITIINGIVYSMHSFGVVAGSAFARISKAMRSATAALSLPTLDQVVRRLCLRTEQLTDADIDVTDLASDYVRGMAVSQVTTTRATLEMLGAAYLFESVESDVIKFVKRGAAPVATIPFADLGASSDASGVEPLPKKELNDIEIPAQVTIKYANTLNDFQDGSESGDRLTTNSTAVSVVELPIAFEPGEAKKLADAQTMDLAVSLSQLGPIAVTRKWVELEPTDPILVIDEDGSSFRVRIVKMTINGGVTELTLALDDATVINSEALTDDSYVSSTLVRLLSDTVLKLLDIPILRDADDSPGFYAAFGASTPWSGAELDKSPDDVTYTKVLDTADRAVMGQASTVLGDFTGGVVFDEVNTLTVDVGDGTLSNSTRDALLTSQVNALLVGHEIIQFRTRTLVSPGVYTLSGLLRGLRGTEWAMASHDASERVVLLQTTGIRRVAEQQADVGLSNYYKAVTHGKSRASAGSQTFIDTGVGQKPFSVADLRALPNEAGDILLSWNRRSRLSTSFVGPSGSVVPLGEAVELYSVEVVDGLTDAPYRQNTTATPSFAYTAAMQAVDGVVASTNFYFRVSQRSAAVGDGYPSIVRGVATRIATSQISTITVGGTFHTGDPLFVQIDSTTTYYTVLVGDATLTGVATALDAALSSAHPTYSITSAGPVVTITGLPGVAFTLNVGLVGGVGIPQNLEQSASDVTEGNAEVMTLGLYNAGSAVPFSSQLGAFYALRFVRGHGGFGDRIVTYTIGESPEVVPGGLTSAEIIRRVVTATPTRDGGFPEHPQFNYPTAGSTFPDATFFPIDGRYWEVSGYSSQPGLLFAWAVTRYPTAAVAAPRAQVVSFYPQPSDANPPGVASPVTVGIVYRITINSNSYDYTTLGGDTLGDVCDALALLVDADADVSAVSTTDSLFPIVRVTGAAPIVPFTYAGFQIPGSVTLTAATTQAAS